MSSCNKHDNIVYGTSMLYHSCCAISYDVNGLCHVMSSRGMSPNDFYVVLCYVMSRYVRLCIVMLCYV
jgi:hypothetical protein